MKNRRMVHILLNTALLTIMTSVVLSCSQSQIPTQTPTSEPTKTSAPTNTPLPTDTALPTNTPEPTPTSTNTPSPTLTTTPLPKNTEIPVGEHGGLIVYFSDPEEEELRILTLRVVSADGSFDTGLTFSPIGDKQPNWSPNGQRIAFVRYLQDNEEIYIMDISGGLARLTDDPGIDNHPDWSPDGKQIAFTSSRDGDFDIYVMEIDGSGLLNLTNTTDIDEAHPDWSPDGKQIAYTGFRDGNPDVYVMNADGSGSQRLTDKPGRDVSPAWSPDGQLIAFTSERDGNQELYIMSADGSEQTRLTNNPYQDGYPAWSPDGSKIAFTHNPEWEPDIYLINADGSGLTRLTDSPAVEYEPSWAPQVSAFGEDPWFGPPFCVKDTDGDGFPETPTETFTSDDLFSFIHFPYDNMQDGMNWSHVWIKDGKEMYTANNKWDGGKEGIHTSFYTMPNMGIGMWTIKFYIGDQLMQEVNCEVVEP